MAQDGAPSRVDRGRWDATAQGEKCESPREVLPSSSLMHTYVSILEGLGETDQGLLEFNSTVLAAHGDKCESLRRVLSSLSISSCNGAGLGHLYQGGLHLSLRMRDLGA